MQKYTDPMNERRMFRMNRAANPVFPAVARLIDLSFLFGRGFRPVRLPDYHYDARVRFHIPLCAGGVCRADGQRFQDRRRDGGLCDSFGRLQTTQAAYRKKGFRLFDHFPIAGRTPDVRPEPAAFKGIGFNYIEHEGVRYEAPSFKGLTVEKLSEAWQPQIERLIENRSLLEEGKPNVFLLEADIDEQGNVHKIVELNGALRQYSQIFIDKLYDMAVRGWQPAKKDGVPFRTVCQLRFVLTR